MAEIQQTAANESQQPKAHKADWAEEDDNVADFMEVTAVSRSGLHSSQEAANGLKISATLLWTQCPGVPNQHFLAPNPEL